MQMIINLTKAQHAALVKEAARKFLHNRTVGDQGALGYPYPSFYYKSKDEARKAWQARASWAAIWGAIYSELTGRDVPEIPHSLLLQERDGKTYRNPRALDDVIKALLPDMIKESES